MRFFKLFVFLFLFSFFINNNQAQSGGKGFVTTVKRIFKKTPWTFNLGSHVVDDDGNPFNNLFNVSKTWNFVPYPSRLAIDGYLRKGFSVQAEFAFTKYKSGKTIQNQDIKSDYSFFSTDVNLKYDLNEVFGDLNWFDPYVIAGYGYTKRSIGRNPNNANANVGLGFNAWIYQNLGLSLQSLAKFSMQEGTSNYLHHSVGIVYRFEYGMGNRPGKLGRRYTFLKTTK